MGKVGEVYEGNINWDGESKNDEDDSYSYDIISIPCENAGCKNDVFTTKYEYKINENDDFCSDCLTRYGSSKIISTNTLEILNDPNGVHKCIKNLKHDVSILSDLGCFECSVNSVKLLQNKQTSYNESRLENVTMGSPTLVDGILFRSKSESFLYSQLKKFDNDLLYEMLYTKVIIENKAEYYNPDFYLPNLNLFIEYRGYNVENDDKKKRQWRKTYSLANKIKRGLKNHLTWNSGDIQNADYCKLLIIAPKAVQFFEKGNGQTFPYTVCPHCNKQTSLLNIFGNTCFLCGQ